MFKCLVLLHNGTSTNAIDYWASYPYILFFQVSGIYSFIVDLEQLDNNAEDEKTDTDKNMATIFEILRKMKRVRLERILLNRASFAQTVENLFALSFLVKDGRVAITVDESGSHFVCKMLLPQ